MPNTLATISSPEFINLQPLDINPLMSKCEIKVLYVGQNRNQSYITKEVAAEMAKTLRGAPIVGYFREDVGDFRDHGDLMTWDCDGVKFECLTKPYGFVSPDAEVWFQTFTDTDEFGNQVEHEYLMTTGYLWTGQYEEVKSVIKKGKGQSMELDDDTLQGHWSTDTSNGMDFFIINDATFTKLCILGDDVEPCFEGAEITAPKTEFSMDTEFKRTLFQMIEELKYALGGQTTMPDEEKNLDKVVQNELQENDNSLEDENTVIETAEEDVKTEVEEVAEVETEVEAVAETESEEAPVEAETEVEFEKKEDETKDEAEEEKASAQEEDSSKEEEDKYALLEAQYNELQEKYSNLETSYQALVEFKKEIDNKEKDAMISRFYMLDEADLKDVKENKENYSVEEIESKLATICFRKKISFAEEQEVEKDICITTFNLDTADTDNTPEWIKAVEAYHSDNF